MATIEYGNYSSPYDFMADYPMQWAMKAVDFKYAADCLYQKQRVSATTEDVFLLSPCLLLMGLSLETVMKALYVHLNPIQQKSDLGKIKTHNLVKLASSVNFSLEKHEKSLLAKLSESIIWQSKYPVPVEKHAENYNKYNYDASLSDWEFTLFSNLFDQLYSKIPPVVKKQSPRFPSRPLQTYK